MKTNQSNSTVGKRTISKAILILALCMTGMMGVQAAGNKPFADNEPTVTSMGVVSGEMSFKLKYDNVKGEKVEIVLRDKEGTQLFRQVYNDKVLDKTFKVPADIQTLVLRITNLNTKTEQKFEISTQAHVVEEVVVTSAN